MSQRSDWFTIVATDLFAAAFAAILIIDAASPKELFVQPSDAYFEMSYPLGKATNSGKAPCKDNNVAFAFSFLDDDGNYRNSLGSEAKLSVNEEGDSCIVRGLFIDVTVATEPREPFVLLLEYPVSAQLSEDSIEVKYNQTTFKCLANNRCVK